METTEAIDRILKMVDEGLSMEEPGFKFYTLSKLLPYLKKNVFRVKII